MESRRTVHSQDKAEDAAREPMNTDGRSGTVSVPSSEQHTEEHGGHNMFGSATEKADVELDRWLSIK
ncbi:hypothetical protein STEG23_038143, partial [Scotinomys teguina]